MWTGASHASWQLQDSCKLSKLLLHLDAAALHLHSNAREAFDLMLAPAHMQSQYASNTCFTQFTEA